MKRWFELSYLKKICNDLTKYSDRLLSVVCPSVHVSVNLSHFSSSWSWVHKKFYWNIPCEIWVSCEFHTWQFCLWGPKEFLNSWQIVTKFSIPRPWDPLFKRVRKLPVAPLFLAFLDMPSIVMSFIFCDAYLFCSEV